MKLIKHTSNGYELADYLRYLDEERDRFPANAWSFALASWHYDMQHSQCPHDSWLESLDIQEGGAGKERRRIQIAARFLGAYHDGSFELVYADVQSYSGLMKEVAGLGAGGHGDWLVDEVLAQDDGSVSHEIVFSSGARWQITARDIVYRWLPKH
jgi:hypothetical protein